jgi:uncharacterized protein (TIGR02246 family)
LSSEDEIRRTLSLIPQAWDSHDAEALGGQFVEGGCFMPPSGQECLGRTAITKYAQQHFERLRPDRRSNHTDADYTITVTGDRAEAVGDGAVFERFGEGPGFLRSICRYANQLVHEDGQWLIAEQKVTLLWRAAGDIRLPPW